MAPLAIGLSAWPWSVSRNAAISARIVSWRAHAYRSW
jgi:hypothetical protein